MSTAETTLSPSSGARIPTQLRTAVRKWNSSLAAFSNWLMSKLLLYPISSILWPCVLVLTLAYPTIYNSYLSPHSLLHSLFPHPSRCVKSVDFLDDLSDSHPDITIKTFSVEHDTGNLLTKEFLLQFYDIQSSLFDGLNITKDGDALFTDEHSILVYSPLDFWDNNKSKLLHSDSIIKTIQLNGWHTNGPHSQPLNNVQLFSGITKSDGLIRSAKSLRLVSYYRNSQLIDVIIKENLKSIQSQYPHLNIFSEPKDHNARSIGLDDHTLKLNVSAKYCNCIDFFYIYLMLPILAVQCILRVKRNKFIRSKIGLLVAFFVQLILTSLASVTIVSICDTHSELLQLPFPLLIFIPFSVNIINVSRLILSFSNFATDISFISRVQKTVNHSFPISTTFNLVILLVLNVCRLFTHSKCSLLYCSFSSLCVIFNFFLTYTYTLTILIVDLNNVELQDLIQNAEKVNEDMDEIEDGLAGKLISGENRIFGSNEPITYFARNYLTTRFLVFNACSLLAIIPIVLQWTEGVSFRLPNDSNNLLDIFLNKRGFAYELLTLNRNINNVSLEISRPVLLSTQPDNSQYQNYHQTTLSSTFDVFYFLEFISFLIFAISTLALMLKVLIDSEQNSEYSKSFSVSKSNSSSNNCSNSLSTNLQSFQSKDLVKGHVLDIVKLCTSSCPFIVSVGIDHKILVWSPLKYPIPSPTLLPISAKFLPVTHVEMSDSGSAITVFSRSGEIKCWSRSSMSWVWTISLEELANDIPLVSFFRKRTSVSNGRRKLVSRVSRQSKEHASSSQTPTTRLPVSSPVPPPLPPAAEKNTLQSGRRLSLDSNFDQSIGLKESSNMEFIIVLKNGAIISIECSSGKFDKAVLSDSSLLCAKKLISPRVNDRIVGVKENGELVVSTVVNNKWRSRPVKIDASNYNKGKSLITPAVLLKYPEFNYSTTASSLPPTSNFMSRQKSNVDKRVDFVDDNLNDLLGIVMETVPFVGMIVRAFGSKCQLIDVQSGTMLKEWQICQFKVNTFKVFHPEPSHCRFCGCASVASFSVAYTEMETNSLIMHTFSIDNRAKNNICLRVERDSRETRCLGFASVTEHQHILSNVEGWCPTDMNILMGVRRKEKDGTQDSFPVATTGVANVSSDSENNILKNIFETSGIGLRKRKNRTIDVKSDSLESRTIVDDEIDNSIKELKVSPIIESSAFFRRDTKKAETNTTRRLSDIWEGWTMSADGQVRLYEIPDGSDSGLLIKKLGPVCKFGHKSLVVSFGNIMKVLYLGNDSLVEEDSPNDEDASSARYQSSSSLSFINRRRKLRMKKYDLTHSTNFEDSSAVSTDAMA